MNIQIDIREISEGHYVTIHGEIDVYTAPQVKEKLLPISEIENSHLIVDLSDVSYLDSTGLGIFIGAFKNIKKHNGEFKLVGLSERLERLFSITGLSGIMDIDRKLEGGVK
ncbi:anti-sigma factor antagonist [Litchfieldia alkalitelluris]|uniref:anti-sigma factor antagonist n=1 Tax=Litchfieldia alkalitelluris TaxID=304268 RepID=UPI000997D990|nr:anti-sigma factor antagonist [Litchfieldia alkalitelluris]